MEMEVLKEKVTKYGYIIQLAKDWGKNYNVGKSLQPHGKIAIWKSFEGSQKKALDYFNKLS